MLSSTMAGMRPLAMNHDMSMIFTRSRAKGNERLISRNQGSFWTFFAISIL